MKKHLNIVPLATTAIAAMAANLGAAPITNPGFETGNETGWTESNPSYSAVLSTYTATPLSTDGRVYTAPEGSYFLAVASGGSSTTGGTTVFQVFDMNAGDTLSGWAAFDAREPRGYPDTAIAAIQVSLITTILYSRSVPASDPLGSTDWETWSFTAPSDGSYTIAFAVGNAVDNNQTYNSVGLFDLAITAYSPVPDAGSAMLLLGCALTGVEGIRRRFRRA